MVTGSQRFSFLARNRILLNILLTVILVAFGNVAQFFSKFNLAESPLWSPTGIALAAILLFGFEMVIPGMAMGFFLLTLQMAAPPFTSLGVFLSNLMEPILGAMLLFAYGKGQFKLTSLKDTLLFLALTFLAPFIFCTTNLAFMYQGKLIPSENFSEIWLSYYASDVSSILIFTPLVVSLFYRRESTSRFLEKIFVFAAIITTYYWGMHGNPNKIFIVLPFLIWAAIRFSILGVGISAVLLTFIGMWRVLDGVSLERNYFWVQYFAGAVTMVGYIIATVSDADKRAHAKEMESYINLEHKKIAEEALAILDQSIQKSPIGFSLVDKEMRFIRINEIMADLNGKTTDFHLGKTIREIIPELANEMEAKVTHVFSTGETLLNIPMQGYSKSHPSELILGLQSYYPVKHPITEEVFGVAMSFQDMTEQKNIEQKLRVTEANLLHALSVRDEFVATASHELKTPLTSLRLQNELFQKALVKQDPFYLTREKVSSILERNSKQIERLSRLVDDMLDISRIKTGKLSIKYAPCDLNQILTDVLARTKDQFETSGSGLPEVQFGENPIGEWDPLRIEQVMTNLITNSIRYGRGKPISISIQSFNETVRFSIKDQGLGIAKSDQKKIFQRYERGLLAREISGLGLGLYICEQIVEAHQGMIWVESEVNQGASFFVELPRTQNLSKNLSEEPQGAIVGHGAI